MRVFHNVNAAALLLLSAYMLFFCPPPPTRPYSLQVEMRWLLAMLLRWIWNVFVTFLHTSPFFSSSSSSLPAHGKFVSSGIKREEISPCCDLRGCDQYFYIEITFKSLNGFVPKPTQGLNVALFPLHHFQSVLAVFPVICQTQLSLRWSF